MAPPNTGAISTKSANAVSFADQPVGVKAMILVLAVSVVAGGYYFAFHMGLSEDIERAQREHATLVTQRAEAVQRQQEFVRVSQELAEREPLDRRNRRILPENAEMAAFLGDINRIAELAGLGIDLVEPQPESPDEFYVRIPVKLKFHGRFHQFAKFFHSVSQLERAVSLENLNISVDAATVARAATAARAAGAAQASGADSAAASQVMLRVELMATTFRRPRADKGAAPARGRGARARPAATGMMR